MWDKTIRYLLLIAVGSGAVACTSGPFKWNQSGRPAAVVDNAHLPQPANASFTVLIVPSGAIRTQYISDRTSTAGGLLGSMVVGPIAGAIGGLVGSSAGSTAAASAEEEASKKLDSSDISQALAPIDLPHDFARILGEKLNQCGIRTVISPSVLSPDRHDWSSTHLMLSETFRQELAPYRFFVQANVLGLQVRAALKDTTMEGDAYARVYETRSLRQIGRYAYKTGSTGSVTLNAYSGADSTKKAELQQASQQVARYLAGGIANDMCAIMTRL